MRRLVIVVAFVAVQAFGSVDMPSPKVESLAPDRVLEACDGRSAKGCTRLEDARMLCECLQDKDGWRVSATVHAVPSIYIANVSWMRHEMLHVWDFEYYLRAHVKAVGKRRFATRGQCDRMLEAVAAAFPETVQRIGRLSADRRDGKRVARSEDHLVVMKAEIVPQLVNDGLANLADDLAPAARHPKDRTAEDRNLIGQRGKHVEASLRQSNTAVDAQQLVSGRTLFQSVAVFFTGLFFDDDDHVVEQPRKLVRQLFESLFDELVELRRA